MSDKLATWSYRAVPADKPDHYEIYAWFTDVPYLVTCSYQSMEDQEEFAKLLCSKLQGITRADWVSSNGEQ